MNLLRELLSPELYPLLQEQKSLVESSLNSAHYSRNSQPDAAWLLDIDVRLAPALVICFYEKSWSDTAIDQLDVFYKQLGPALLVPMMIRLKRPPGGNLLLAWLTRKIKEGMPAPEGIEAVVVRALGTPALKFYGLELVGELGSFLKPTLLKAATSTRSPAAGRVFREVLHKQGWLSVPVASANSALAQSISALLELWRATRNSKLAYEIERLSQYLPKAPFFESATEQENWWNTALSSGDPSWIPALLSAPWPANWKDGRQRLERISGMPSDPRFGSWALSACGLVSYRYQSHPFWRSWFQLLKQCHDPRFLIEASKQLEWVVSSFRYHDRSVERWEAELAALSQEQALSKEQNAEQARILAAVGIADREVLKATLLKEVYARPEDMAARLVYADLLLEEGDSRGEFIQLQVKKLTAPEATDRRLESRLLKQYQHQWLLKPYGLDPEGCVFSGGFLEKIRITPLQSWEEIFSYPLWATVHTLASHHHLTPDALLKLPLRIKTAFSVWSLSSVATALESATQLTGLGVQLLDEPRLLKKLPQLQFLAVQAQLQSLEWLAELPITRLRLCYGSIMELITLLERTDHRLTCVERISGALDKPDGWIYRLLPEENFWSLDLQYQPGAKSLDYEGILAGLNHRIRKLIVRQPKQLSAPARLELQELPSRYSIPVTFVIE